MQPLSYTMGSDITFQALTNYNQMVDTWLNLKTQGPICLLSIEFLEIYIKMDSNNSQKGIVKRDEEGFSYYLLTFKINSME